MRARRVLAPALALLIGGAFVASVPASATTARWASAATAKVHPGIQTITAGTLQCTANFVFKAGTKTYLGQAAHCSSTGGDTDTNGCTTRSMPLGTTVDVNGYTGKMVYNSWVAMRSAREKDASTCAYNDLALIELPAAAVATTNPSVPVYGGPIGLGSVAPSGSNVLSFGNSSLRFGLTALSPKRGISLGQSGNGWSTEVYTVTPGIPGDSGSGFLDGSGKAIGVLSTIGLLPHPADNNIGNLSFEIAYAKRHGMAGLTLVNGTQPFTRNALG